MKKVYYIVELDSYNQPTNTIKEVELTSKEFKELKRTYVYIYKTWLEAEKCIDWHICN